MRESEAPSHAHPGKPLWLPRWCLCCCCAWNAISSCLVHSSLKVQPECSLLQEASLDPRAPTALGGGPPSTDPLGSLRIYTSSSAGKPCEGRAIPGHGRCPEPCPTLPPNSGSKIVSCEEMRFVERAGEVIRTGTPLAARSLRGSPGRIPPSAQSHTSVKVRHNCETSAPVSNQHPTHLHCLLLPEYLGAVAGAQQNKCAHYCGD